MLKKNFKKNKIKSFKKMATKTWQKGSTFSQFYDQIFLSEDVNNYPWDNNEISLQIFEISLQIFYSPSGICCPLTFFRDDIKTNEW